MCSGELGSKWSNTLKACISGSAAQACDSINQTTCYVARFDDQIEIEEPATLSSAVAQNAIPSAIITWDIGVDENNALVVYVGPVWYQDGLRGGDRIQTINSSAVDEDLLAGLYNQTGTLQLTVLRGGNVLSLSVN